MPTTPGAAAAGSCGGHRLTGARGRSRQSRRPRALSHRRSRRPRAPTAVLNGHPRLGYGCSACVTSRLDPKADSECQPERKGKRSGLVSALDSDISPAYVTGHGTQPVSEPRSPGLLVRVRPGNGHRVSPALSLGVPGLPGQQGPARCSESPRHEPEPGHGHWLVTRTGCQGPVRSLTRRPWLPLLGRGPARLDRRVRVGARCQCLSDASHGGQQASLRLRGRPGAADGGCLATEFSRLACH